KGISLLPSNGRILLDLNGDPDLDIIPWEYALTYDSELGINGYLTKKYAFLRLHRRMMLQQSELSPLPLRIVTVIPDPIIPPNDSNAMKFPDLHLSDQFQALCDEYKRNNRAVSLQRVFPPTVDQMYELLSSKSEMATVLHFMGHCGSQKG